MSKENIDIPQIGLGTWKNKGEQCTQSVLNALDVGYRFIDTAQAYKNEEYVGKAIKKTDIPRNELIIATKVWVTRLSPNWLKRSVKKSLKKLGLDYVDILYIHWPAILYCPKRTLGAMNEVVKKGQAKYIGVSNFTPKQVKKGQEVSEHQILANQVEAHPFLPQSQMRQFLSERNMHLIAYSPLARGDVINNETIRKISEKHNATAAQVSLAWSITKGMHPIPKATSRKHIKDNFKALDLNLTPEDINKIDQIDIKERKVNPAILHPDWGEI